MDTPTFPPIPVSFWSILLPHTIGQALHNGFWLCLEPPIIHSSHKFHKCLDDLAVYQEYIPAAHPVFIYVVLTLPDDFFSRLFAMLHISAVGLTADSAE